MKILNNIAGAIIDSNPAKLRVNLYTIWSGREYPTFNLIESCSLDTISKTVIYPLSPSVKLLLEMEYITYDVYEDYETLFSKLNLELPKTISKAWYPNKGEKAFIVDERDEIIEIISTTLDEKSIKTYKYFPTKELAKKSINLSKLDKLVLLWQYSNNYLFTPDWKNSREEIKYYFIYNHTTENLEVVNFNKEMGNNILFKTKYHVEDFITLYSKEILKLLSIKGED